MKKVFTRRCKALQIILVSFATPVCIFVAAIPFSIGYQTGSRSYFIGSFLIVFLAVALLSYAILDIYRRITIDSLGITVKKPFRSISFSWADIVEFRAHEKGIGWWAGWRYYLISNGQGNKTIEIADNNIKDLDELIDAIFRMAKNATFVRIENVSSIPFLRRSKVSQWDRESRIA